MSCYAVAGETVNRQLAMGALTLLKTGAASYQNQDATSVSRWGDYSATSVDPADPNRFWTIQMYPVNAKTWATQITEIIANPVKLRITVGASNLVLSWLAGASGVQLQSAPAFPVTTPWTPVPQAPTVSNHTASIMLPMSAPQGYFRLAQP